MKSRPVFSKPVQRPDHISSYIRREWKTLLIVAVSGTLFNMGQSLCAVRQGGLVDAVARLQTDGDDRIFSAAWVFLLTVAVVQLLRLVKRYFVRRFANATDISMRMMVYNHLIYEDYQELNRENSGDIMTKALGDVDLTVEGMRKVTTEIFDTGVLLVTYFLTMLHYSVRCTVLSCLTVPVALLSARFLRTFVETYNRRCREMSACVASASLDAVRNSMLYRVTGSTKRVEAEYEKQLTELEKDQIRAGVLENSMQPVYNAVTLCGTLAVLLFGGRLTVAGTWSVGTFSAYLTIYLAFALKIAKVSKLFNSYQKAKVSWGRVKPYLTGWKEDPQPQPQTPDRMRNADGEYPAVGAGNPERKCRADGTEDPDRKCRADRTGNPDGGFRRGQETSIVLLCRNLTVSRDGKKELFSPVSFAGRRGQIIGITGPVASGKSSLGMAVAGLLPYKGTVRVLGHDLSILSGAEKSGLISYMGHEPQLFDLSVRDNILLGREEIPGRLEEVLRDVCLDADLRKMEMSGDREDMQGGAAGFPDITADRPTGSADMTADRPTGSADMTADRGTGSAALAADRGTGSAALAADRRTGSGGRALSGGQRSRISCARALYEKPPLIVLDEPFANVDRETEHRMIRNLREHYSRSLLVILSHRMDVFEKADLVLVIEDSGYVRAGTHEELLQSSAAYLSLWEMQRTEKENAEHTGKKASAQQNAGGGSDEQTEN